MVMYTWSEGGDHYLCIGQVCGRAGTGGGSAGVYAVRYRYESDVIGTPRGVQVDKERLGASVSLTRLTNAYLLPFPSPYTPAQVKTF